MVKIKLLNRLIFFFVFSSILIPQLLLADLQTYSTSITISAQVGDLPPPTPPVNSGGGGGGGGNTVIVMPTTVNFSGMAYPSSKVIILNNGNIAVTTIADSQARFSVSINNLATGTYNFSVFGEDSSGVKSLSFSFPVYVTEGTTVNIGGIFLSPTINIDKSEVKKGENLIVFGQTIPNTKVNIVFHSDQEILEQTTTGPTGLYKYNMDTTPLAYGNHNVKSKTITKDDASAISVELPFTVGLVSKLEDEVKDLGLSHSDINDDNKVNLVDFSIMTYWYNRSSPPVNVDLNEDGKINLVDFSIMAFNWTG